MTEQEARYIIDDISWVYKGTYITDQMRNECREVCHSALEKQIPKKVYIWANGDAHCPNEECDCNVEGWFRDEYCHKCGQRLDWSE